MNLTAEQTAKLARLHNRSTLYEVRMTNQDTGDARLLCYTRRTKRGVWDYVTKHAERVVAFCGSDRMYPGDAPGVDMRLGRWAIGFTGRTQREAITHGELPWFGKEEAR